MLKQKNTKYVQCQSGFGCRPPPLVPPSAPLPPLAQLADPPAAASDCLAARCGSLTCAVVGDKQTPDAEESHLNATAQ